MEIFEGFNTSTVSQPYFEAHRSFVTNPKIQLCGVVQELPTSQQCVYVTDTAACHEGEQYLDYMHFLYCVVGTHQMSAFYFCVLLLICMCCLIFVVLGETADRFFCPALAALAKAMGMSENLAGVTLLAFGNGSPDIFTALADFKGDTELLYAELFGAAAFISGVVASSIIIIRPFCPRPSDVIRDTIFFLFGCFWVGRAFSDEKFHYVEAIGTIFIYILYLAAVFVDHFWDKIGIKRKVKGQAQYDRSSSLTNQLRTLNDRSNFYVHNSKTELPTEDEAEDVVSVDKHGPNYRLFPQFLSSLNPIDLEEWHESRFFGKLCAVLKAPIVLILTLLIPCVDYSLPINGWSKLLNILHVVLLPLGVVIMKQFASKTIAGQNVCLWILAIGIPLAAVVFFTSRTDRPPKYQLVFAVFGSFVGSILVISSMAKEVVAVLSTLGVVSNMSNSFLGLSVLAWGNSVGDLISNIALARKGYYRMGYAACFGGPLFNSMLGIGIVFTLKLAHSTEDTVYAREGPMGKTCNLFLAAILLFALLSLCFCNFQGRRSVGFLLISIYFMFLMYAVLGEFHVVHTYGTDHRNEGQYEN